MFRARQRAGAARVLFFTGHTGEAIAQIDEAITFLEGVVEGPPRPTRDRGAHRRFVDLMECYLAYDAATPRAMTERARRARIVRWVVALVAIATASALWLAWAWPRVQVTGSGALHPYHAVTRVADGEIDRTDAEWISGGPTGWVQLALRPARRIARMRLKNARGANFDYGAKEFRIELRDEGRLVGQMEGEFPAPLSNDPWWVRDLPAPVLVDHVTVYVDSSWGNGAGLSEVAWDEASE